MMIVILDPLAPHRAHRAALAAAHDRWIALHYRPGRVPRGELRALPELRRRRASNDTSPPRAA